MLTKIYIFLPWFIQNIFITLKGCYITFTRLNRTFKKELQKLIHGKVSQKKLLTAFLVHANAHTKYYNNSFNKFQVNLLNENIYEEISKLPILTKAEVKNHRLEIKAEKKSLKNSRILKVSTSGTTGSGLKFWQTQLMENRQWAIWWRYRIWNGIEMNTWCGWFGGKIIMDISNKKPPFWRINVPGKQIMFSSYHLNKSTAAYYFNKLKKSQIRWIHGYPSQIALLAGYIEELGLGKLPDLKIITYGSENLYPHQHKLIDRVFGVPIRTHYGLAEGVANISQLPDGSFRIDDEFCYVELIATDDPERFKIVGTNFSNYAFPLIRYDTGDIALVKNVNGALKIQGFEGRIEDYVTTPEGLRITRLGFIFKDQIFVKEAQIYQPDLYNIVFRIVELKGFDRKIHEKEILKNAKERLGNGFNYSFEYLGEIEKTSSGKLKYIVSKV